MKLLSGKNGLIFATIIVVIINISNLIEYFAMGHPLNPISTTCFVAGLVFIAIAWVQYFNEKKKNGQ